MDYKRAVGRRIKEAREHAGLSQAALAEKLEVNTGTVSAIERGINFPSAELLFKILNTLDATADYIFQDVQPKGYLVYESELDKKLSGANPATRRFIYRMIEAALAQEEEKGKASIS